MLKWMMFQSDKGVNTEIKVEGTISVQLLILVPNNNFA